MNNGNGHTAAQLGRNNKGKEAMVEGTIHATPYRLSEKDSDVIRYVGMEPEPGSVRLRCAGCGVWIKPDLV